MTLRQEKINTLFAKLVARFLQDTTTEASIITVTHFDISKDLRNAHAYLSIFPENKEEAVMRSIKKNQKELKLNKQKL